MATSVRFLIILLLAACKSNAADPGPSCDRIVDHMMEITKQQLAGHDAFGGDMRKQAITSCEQRKLSKEARVCLLAAKNSEDATACYRGTQPK